MKNDYTRRLRINPTSPSDPAPPPVSTLAGEEQRPTRPIGRPKRRNLPTVAVNIHLTKGHRSILAREIAAFNEHTQGTLLNRSHLLQAFVEALHESGYQLSQHTTLDEIQADWVRRFKG